MTRKERETGLDIKVWLTHAVSHGEISAEDMCDAMGVTRSTFYRWVKDGRDGTFPNEEEVDLLASGLDLENRYGISANEIKVRFGIITMDDIQDARERLQELEQMEHLLHPPAKKGRKEVTTTGRKRALKNVKDDVRSDAPPL